MSQSKPLRGGLIGCGFFSQFHLEAWRRMPEVELVAASDLDLDRARAAAPHAYASPEEMLDREELDFVDIVTRPESHLSLVRLAVRHRVAAICQKPMAPNWEECVAIADEADHSGVRVMMHENWRWQRWYREAQRLIAAGAIGRPYAYRFRTCKRDGLGPEPYPDQPYFRNYSRLLIYETLVHHLDTARFLFGDVTSVYATMRRNNPVIAGEDQVHIILRHNSGLLGNIDGNRIHDTDPPGPVLGETWFEGEDAILHVHPTGNLFLGGRRVWQNTTTQGYRGESILDTQRHFIDCLCSGEPFETGARDYLNTVALVEAAYLSAQSNRAVTPAV
jgi:predicted dehydrogenase